MSFKKRFLRMMVITAFMAALSIVLGKYLAINIGEVMRFSFENLPILFCGMALGPIAGLSCGILADLVGCVLVGYAINPIITLGAAAIGAIGGIYRFLPKTSRALDILLFGLTVALAHVIGSVIIKTYGLAVYYDMPLYALMLWRLLNYGIVGGCEGALLYHLLKNRAISKEISKITSGRKKMNYEEALNYIHGISWTFCKPGLERTEALCAAVGNPQDSLKFVHVAGTNGKGSFCSMLSSILLKSGLNVGLYTSPYITEFNERMRFNGENISNEMLCEVTEYVKTFADKMEDKPTEFELITVIAFEYFKRMKCDVVVLEAGMGGRLDSTNIIKTPILSVITGIALDHTAFLGDTVEKIAAEKAGIIKPGVPVIYGGEDEAAGEVIALVAKERGSELSRPDYSEITDLASTLRKTSFSYLGFKDLEINLLGLYQPKNAALTLLAATKLRELLLPITEKSIREGLCDAAWPARFEIINHHPITIFDGAHNPQGITASVESIIHYFGKEKVTIVTGVLKDKDYQFIAKELARVGCRAFTLTPDNPRALSAEEYAAVLCDAGVFAEAADSISDAVAKAVAYAEENETAVVCLGSLYTYGDVVSALDQLGVRKRR